MRRPQAPRSCGFALETPLKLHSVRPDAQGGRSPSSAMPGATGGGSAGGGGGVGGDAATPAGQQIDAFTIQEVVIEKRLVCLEAWGSYALLGLSGEANRVLGALHCMPAALPTWTARNLDCCLLRGPLRPPPLMLVAAQTAHCCWHHSVGPAQHPAAPPPAPPQAAVPPPAVAARMGAAARRRQRRNLRGGWCSRCASSAAGG